MSCKHCGNGKKTAEEESQDQGVNNSLKTIRKKTWATCNKMRSALSEALSDLETETMRNTHWLPEADEIQELKEKIDVAKNTIDNCLLAIQATIRINISRGHKYK